MNERELRAAELLRSHGWTVLAPKSGRVFRCSACGYLWTGRKSNPKYCPRDHRATVEVVA